MSTTMIPPDEVLTAQREQLRLGNEVRRKRPVLLARLHSMGLDEGLLWCAAAIEDPPELLAGMTVFDLLSKVRMLHAKTIDAMMLRAEIGPISRLRELELINRASLGIILRDRAAGVARDRAYRLLVSGRVGEAGS